MKLSSFVDEYLAYKRALGMRFNTEDHLLHLFCRGVDDVDLADVTADQVRRYLDGSLPVSSYWQRKHTALAVMPFT